MPKLTPVRELPRERVPNPPSDICCECEKSFIWINNKGAKKSRLCYWCFNTPPKRVKYPEDELLYHGKKVGDIKREEALKKETQKKEKTKIPQHVQDKIDKAKVDKDMKASRAKLSKTDPVKRKFNPWRPRLSETVEE